MASVNFVHRRSYFRTLQNFFKQLDRPYRFATNLAFFGLLGTIVGAYFQYNSWRDEKTLARYHEELATANATFSELASALSSVMNLQQMLFYTHRDAHDTWDDGTYIYLSDNAKRVYENYFSARTALRQNIDILSGKAALFIDRPLDSDEKRIEKLAESKTLAEIKKLAETNFVVSNRDILSREGLNCAEHMPNRDQPTQLKSITIDWTSVRQQVAAFYFCSDAIHYSLLPIRIWAQSGDHIQDIDDFHPKNPAFKCELERQALRLNAIILTSLKKIEALRLKGLPRGFFRHQFFCLWSCSE